MATTSISPEARARGYLVRGIDPIPEGWEHASAHRSLRSLYRSATVLQRLIGDALSAGHKARARDLRSVLIAVKRGAAHQSGGFDIKEIAAEARKWKAAERAAKRWRARRQTASRPRLVVDNTRVLP